VHFPSEDTENYTLEYSFQQSPGTLPGQSQKMNSSQPELNDNWTKVSYKRGSSTQKENEKEAKHAKESEYWFNRTSTSSLYTALLEEGSKDQQQKAGPENAPKPPPVYITDVKNISPLIQLLEQIAEQQYEIKAFAYNQVQVRPKTSESYRKIIKVLAEKHEISHLQIKRRNKLQSSVNKYALLHQPCRNQN
jgi:hypothetical protein